MNDQPATPSRALSFAGVADAYDRARPSYPREAAEWLTGPEPLTVLELGAGTGKLTDLLLDLGHDVLAVDPLDEMLSYLRARRPECRTVTASAEEIPAPSRSVDVVVCGQSFHWFDTERALPEIARVLKPEGVLSMVWNVRDDRIPWVRKLGRLIDTPQADEDPTEALVGSRLFGYVEQQEFRFWQPLRKPELRDLVTSRSNVAIQPVEERETLLHQVDQLYDEYGRGPDGMLLPYVTLCYRAVVRPVVLDDTGPTETGADGEPSAERRTTVQPIEDDGTTLFSLS
jgi:SAM-dependent methyltransferase